ncbi:MAG TPA: hypothetical protein VKH35_16835 [Thermoanaerobaculia bacterium]|jgi:hypothetical protein|nr:hypothetical protein [Thermoanaerobaculia bacterium]
MSRRDAGYQAFRALEMMLHESSHTVVDPNYGTVAAAIAAAAKTLDIPIPRNLWHAILFETSSELTRRALAEDLRGTPHHRGTEITETEAARSRGQTIALDRVG